MSRILVAGLINVETTVRIEAFPINYEPVRFPFGGVNSTVSGVGYNLAKALTVLGNEVRFLAMIGNDPAATLVRHALSRDQISSEHIFPLLDNTPQSAILYDQDGRRMINVDLKTIQETAYPVSAFDIALKGCKLAILGNINFARPFLERARNAGVAIASDVHTIANLDDPYNRDYMAAADILFMSDEALPEPPDQWIKRVQAEFETPIVVIGMGREGALLSVRQDQHVIHIPAVQLRPIVNTIGAGDALFAAFNHVYAHTGDPYLAIRKAIAFAGYKIGTAGAADGFLSEQALDELYQQRCSQ